MGEIFPSVFFVSKIIKSISRNVTLVLRSKRVYNFDIFLRTQNPLMLPSVLSVTIKALQQAVCV